MTRGHPLIRAYALLLRLYPAESRHAWGVGMEETFRERFREMTDAGPWTRLRFACKELGSVLSTAFRERYETAQRPGRPALFRTNASTPTPPRSPRRDILNDLFFDLRSAARGWRATPLTTAVILLTLALGIGATTAVFTIVNGVLLQPLPFPAAERLVRVHETLPDGDTWSLSMPDFVDLREQVANLDSVAVYQTASLTLSRDGDASRIRGMRVSPGLFETLGLPLALGRPFAPADEAEGAAPVTILGNNFWRTRYGADRAVLGQPLRLDGVDHTIIGIAPENIDLGSGEPALWVPFEITESGLRNRGGHMYPVIGRIAEGVPHSVANEEVAGFADRLAAAHPDSHEDRGATLQPLQEQILGDVDRPLMMLLGAVGILLLIACTNVASILLARSDARGREIALRSALGASTGRLMRQLLAEALALTLIGGALGVVLASLGVRAAIDTLAAELPRVTSVSMDLRILGFAFTISCVTGIGVGLIPALRTVRRDLSTPMKSASRTLAGSGGFGLHRALVVAEISLAVVLVLGAGLLVKSLTRLQGVDAGFDAQGAVTFRIGLPTTRYEATEDWAAFSTRLRGELARYPGVEAVGGVGLLPFFASQTTELSIVGDQASPLEQVQFRHTTPGFLEAMGTRVLQGRSFDETDVPGAPPVIILNQTAATRLFGDDNPIGRRVTTGWGHHPDELEVVGVVEDVRLSGPSSSAPPAMYWPFGQYDARSVMSYVVRSSGDPASLIPGIRRVVADLDPELPIYSVELLVERTKRSMAQERLNTWLLSGFAALALTLAAIGVFGVMAYGVTRRRQEIGVRVALGASPAAVVRAILLEGAALAALGLTVGTAAGLALGRAFAHLLYETSPNDPATFVAVGATLVAVALLACSLPARRAAAIDPVVVLRRDQ